MVDFVAGLELVWRREVWGGCLRGLRGRGACYDGGEGGEGEESVMHFGWDGEYEICELQSTR